MREWLYSSDPMDISSNSLRYYYRLHHLVDPLLDSRDIAAETAQQEAFKELQEDIMGSFGSDAPEAPVLKVSFTWNERADGRYGM
jgi:hypothetical protein